MLNIDEVDGAVNTNAKGSAHRDRSQKTDNASSSSRQSPKIGVAFSEGAVEAAIACGYSPIPGRWKPGKFKDDAGKWQERDPSDSKRPLQKGWQEFCDRVMTVEEQQAARKKVGRSRDPHLPQIHLAMGFNNVIAIDVDTNDPFVQKIVTDIIGRSPVSRIGSKGFADFFLVEGDLPKSEKWYGRDLGPNGEKYPIIEIMAHGTSVRIPPSHHPTAPNFKYRWVDDDHKIYNTIVDELPVITAAKIAILKERLKDFLYRKPEAQRKPRKTVKKETLTEQLHKRYQALADKQLRDRMDDVAAMSKGGRDRALFVAVCALGVFVHKGYISETLLMAEVESAAKANGFDKEPGGIDQAKRTAQSALDKSAKDELPELEDRPFAGAGEWRDPLEGVDQAELSRKYEQAWRETHGQGARSDAEAEKTEPEPPPGDRPHAGGGGDGGGNQPRVMVWPDLTESGGVVKRSQRNIAAFLRFAGVLCAYNDFSQRPVIIRNNREKPVDDIIMRELWLHADRLGMQANEGYFQSVLLNFCAQSRFNPVQSWIDGLVWDGKPRLDKWTSTYLGMEDRPLYRKQGAIQLIASVRRVRHPGTKHDAMPVLEGPQGTGKSTAIKVLAGGDALFTDSLNIGDEPKVIIEQTSDAWLVELAELAGMQRREVEGVKSFLSRTHDSARMSYDRSNTRRARNFTLWASTNDDEYLIDLTGNRRFWPWKVGTIDLDGLARDRDQLWAEAAHREKAGESIALPAELYAEAAAEQRSRVQSDPWQEMLEESIGDRYGKIVVGDIWMRLGVDSKTKNPAMGKRIANIMKQLGFKKDKQRGHTGAPRNCYSKAGPNGEDGIWLSINH